jgi:hypothetical protein
MTTVSSSAILPALRRTKLLAAAVAAISAASSAAPALPALAGPPQETRPYSCRLYDDAQRKCAFGQCDAREIERLRKECLRDGGRP